MLMKMHPLLLVQIGDLIQERQVDEEEEELLLVMQDLRLDALNREQREKIDEILAGIGRSDDDGDDETSFHHVRSCQERGSWERSVPDCTRMSCGRPKPIAHAEFNPWSE